MNTRLLLLLSGLVLGGAGLTATRARRSAHSYSFAGGVAVLSGAASGIGLALAHQLAQRGSHLALIDRDAPGLTQVAGALQARHPHLHVTTHAADLSDTARIPDLAADVLRQHGRVTLLINNAGVAMGGHFDELSLEDFEWVQSINFRAVVAMTKAFLPALKATPKPQIVNLSSVYGLFGPAGQSAYSASKFAVRGFSEVLRHELAPQGIGVTVVHPGGVRTNVANSARIGRGVRASAAAIDAQRAAMNRTLRMPPDQAAHIILTGVARRAGRVLVGGDAKAADLIVRFLPGTYWHLMQPLLSIPTRG